MSTLWPWRVISEAQSLQLFDKTEAVSLSGRLQLHTLFLSKILLSRLNVSSFSPLNQSYSYCISGSTMTCDMQCKFAWQRYFCVGWLSLIFSQLTHNFSPVIVYYTPFIGPLRFKCQQVSDSTCTSNLVP